MRKWVKTTKGGKSSLYSGKLVKTATNEQYKYPRGRADENYTLVIDRKSTRLNSSHSGESRMPSSA